LVVVVAVVAVEGEGFGIAFGVPYDDVGIVILDYGEAETGGVIGG